MIKTLPSIDSEHIEKHIQNSFDPAIANVFGLNAAIVYRCVQFHCGFVRERFYTLTLEDLVAILPYFGRHQIWVALQTLSLSSHKHTALLIRKPEYRGYSYAPIADELNGKPLQHFDADIAVEVGVVAAIIHNRVRREWLAADLDNPRAFSCLQQNLVRFCVAELKYASENTICRKIKALESAGLLRKRIMGKYRLWYACEASPVLN